MGKQILALMGSVMLAIAPFAPAEAVSQSSLSGWKNVQFGESEAASLAKLKRQFKYERRMNATTHALVGEFGGYRHVRVYPFYKRNQLTTLRFVFSAQDGMDTLDLYYDVVRKVKAVYGQHTGAEFNYYENPVTPPDDETDDDMRARHNRDVYAGRAYFTTYWEFPNDGNIIVVSTMRLNDHPGSELFVAMDYRGEAVRQQLERESTSDF